MLALALVAAVVAGDKVVLRAAPSRTAAQQAVLWRGDWLEVRGEQRGWLKVYDHRHERPGWVVRPAARVVELDERAAPGLRAVVDFLRDAPGQESLGIAYAGLYVKVAPAGGIDAPLLVSLGAMADRLARRASTEAADSHAAQQLEVAQSWGIGFAAIERPAGVRTCYDGAAFRQALALAPGKLELAAAVLGLTEPACEPQLLGATERRARDEAALDLLGRVEPSDVGGPLGNRIRIRRAVIGARLAWSLGRGGDAKAARVADAAVAAFARVDRTELADDDADDFEAAALEVAASRWAAGAPVPPKKADPRLTLTAGEPGETCITVETSPPRCTHGQVWASSFRVAPDHAAAVLAIEPLPGWLELWLFRRVPGGWAADILPPATEGPDLGYVELAGWSADSSRAVIVREAREAGAVHRTWQVIKLDALAIEKQTSRLGDLGVSRSWIAPEWRGKTLALR
ncbi:MAG: hypothetical protein E6J90_32170 [Deltaproteobacteria bacterium]|nr:MAG: hypothetical protein E6J90_32170 [Deltaproteobacteria bacterium]TMQ18125.1 MAG: hypothetical protein E6J91_08660 [Deltaproteobacteria bacterium]